jgi:hypothetical protein
MACDILDDFSRVSSSTTTIGAVGGAEDVFGK